MEINNLQPAFQHNYYLFRRKVFKLFGGAFHVYDKTGRVVFYSKQKAFKLKEDFRIYSDESQTKELLTIKTPHIIDFGATYYVQDTTTSENVGAIKRKGLKSILKDEWVFLSSSSQEIGKLAENSMIMALLSRYFNLIPQKYTITSASGRKVAEIVQHFNPFISKYSMSITDPEHLIDRRLLIAVGVLLAGIERRQ